MANQRRSMDCIEVLSPSRNDVFFFSDVCIFSLSLSEVPEGRVIGREYL
jgi:hypothetical protein